MIRYGKDFNKGIQLVRWDTICLLLQTQNKKRELRQYSRYEFQTENWSGENTSRICRGTEFQKSASYSEHVEQSCERSTVNAPSSTENLTKLSMSGNNYSSKSTGRNRHNMRALQSSSINNRKFCLRNVRRECCAQSTVSFTCTSRQLPANLSVLSLRARTCVVNPRRGSSA